MYFTFFDISALSYNFFFRIAPSLILLRSCRVKKNTRNGSVWQLTLYLTEGTNAGSRPRDKREARSSRPLDTEGEGLQKKFFPPFGPYFGLKIGGGGPPGLLPQIRHWELSMHRFWRCGGAQAKPAIGLFEKNGKLFS